MKKGLVQVKFIEQHIANIQLLDEAGKNSLSPDLVEALIQSLETVKYREDIRVILLSGLLNVFCAGADLETLQKLGQGKMKPVDIVLSKMLLDLPVPVISAIEGHAIGGGLALGLCADMVVLAEESRYGCSFMNMGFTPGMGITKLMEHYMTPAIAHELQYSGSFKMGRDLKGKTNFNYILPKIQVWPKAMELAMAIAEKPSKPLRILKRYLNMQRRKTFEETFSIESLMHEITFDQSDILTSIETNYVR